MLWTMTGTHPNSLANLTYVPPRGCGPHGFYPAGKCKECNRVRAARRRRARGQAERPVGCTPHGYFPAAECRWCNRARRESQRRKAGVKPLVYGCSRHGFFPATKCKDCKREWAAKQRGDMRRLTERESGRLLRYSEWEREQLGKPDAAQTLLERAVRELAHRERAQEALDALNEAMAEAGDTPCKDKREYVDYEKSPTPEQAVAMCSGCPVADLCLAYGREARREYRSRGYRLTGVYGGKAIEHDRKR